MNLMSVYFTILFTIYSHFLQFCEAGLLGAGNIFWTKKKECQLRLVCQELEMEAASLLHSDPRPWHGLKDVQSSRRVAQNMDTVTQWRAGSQEDSGIVTREVMELHYLCQFWSESIWRFCWGDQIWRSHSFFDSSTFYSLMNKIMRIRGTFLDVCELVFI